jgi:hypothetical protein
MSVISIRSAAGIALLAAAVAGGGYALTVHDDAQVKPVKATHAAAHADVTVRHPSTHPAPAAPPKASATPRPAQQPTPTTTPAQQGQMSGQQGQMSGQQWQTPAPTPAPTSSWSPMG